MNATEVALRRDEAADRTTERNRSGVIDALRATAALMVLVDHTSLMANGATPGPVATAISHMLAAGVYLFFVVSGYLIAGPFLRALVNGEPLPRIGAYAVRRAARIYPAYWVAFIAVLVVLSPVGGIRSYQPPVHLLLLQSSWPHVGEPEAIFAPAWTLGIEVVFYLLVPLAALLLRAIHPRKWSPGGLAAAVMAGAGLSIGWTYFVHVGLGSSTSQLTLVAEIGLQMWFFAFCPGMLIALAALAVDRGGLWSRFRALTARPSVCLGLAGALWVAAYAMERSGSRWLMTTSTPTYILACGLVVGCLVVAGDWVKPLVRVLAPIGLISYGIYLWHFIVIEGLLRHTSIGLHGGGLAWLLDVGLVVAITFPLAAASWFGIERPVMRRAAKWVSQRQPERAESVHKAQEDEPVELVGA